MDLTTLARKASRSKFYRWLMSRALNKIVPFNHPHGFKVLEVSEDCLKVKLPYKKRNLNHLKGLHACAIATLCEISSGLQLISRLDPKKYRIILKNLNVKYFYQGKTDAFGKFETSQTWMAEKVLRPLDEGGLVLVDCEVKIYDVQENHLATGTATWQVKDWQKVNLKD